MIEFSALLALCSIEKGDSFLLSCSKFTGNRKSNLCWTHSCFRFPFVIQFISSGVGSSHNFEFAPSPCPLLLTWTFFWQNVTCQCNNRGPKDGLLSFESLGGYPLKPPTQVYPFLGLINPPLPSWCHGWQGTNFSKWPPISNSWTLSFELEIQSFFWVSQNEDCLDGFHAKEKWAEMQFYFPKNIPIPSHFHQRKAEDPVRAEHFTLMVLPLNNNSDLEKLRLKKSKEAAASLLSKRGVLFVIWWF